ncbi:hypothetical protein QE152_g32116 [Popillia japonica]|uniref:Uncharacterized protein n=1 Tax=Popillia japonica TaxID=7064 RepID=A0AAW1J096_POPJA
MKIVLQEVILRAERRFDKSLPASRKLSLKSMIQDEKLERHGILQQNIKTPYQVSDQLALFPSIQISAAKYQNAVSGFRSTGIIPFNPNAIPGYAFLSEDVPSNPVPQTDSSGPYRPQTPQPGCSRATTPPPTKRSAEKLLTEISPIPLTMTTLTKRSRNVAVILNGTNNITELKSKQLAKKRTIGKKTKKFQFMMTVMTRINLISITYALVAAKIMDKPLKVMIGFSALDVKGGYTKLAPNMPISAIYAANVPAKFEFDSI